MQPPTDNLYKFLAIFGLLVGAFSVYVPLLRYIEFNRLTHRAEAIYGPMIEPSSILAEASLAELDCSIYQAYVRDRKQPPKPDPCPKVAEAKARGVSARVELDRLKAQAAPLEVEKNSLWQEYVLFLCIGLGGLLVGVVMCVAGFWLWYVRLQRYLDAAAKAGASLKPPRAPVSKSRRGA